jgi:hypothetical protein
MLLGSGGMPSSHSALCVGLTTSVALCHGVSDCLFPVCLGFTLIVMYDAAGVRRHAGRQAEVCMPLSVRLPVMNSTIWPGTWISLMWLSYCNGSYLCCKDQRLANVLGLCDVRVISASEIFSDATYILSKMMNTLFKSFLCVELCYPTQEMAALLRSLHSSRKSIWKISCLCYVLSARIHGSRVKNTCTYLQWGSSLMRSTATCDESL